jgi:hypothetical protein
VIKKCLYQCLVTGRVRRADDVFVCEFHSTFLKASMSLAPQDRALTTQLLQDLVLGRKHFTEEGALRQTPPKPAPERIIREDDGSVRLNGTMVRWFTPEQMLERLNGGRADRTAYTPPPDVDADYAEQGNDDAD